jgi:alkanesulfonate monooxygenase SsuD/methylene tetrahydromethanopterin reductase-like flavin-dependent oxidoreductase (luciferase family)
MAEARGYVADEAVEQFCLVGSPEECARRIRGLEALGIHQVFLRHYLTYALPWDLIDVAGRAIIPRIRAQDAARKPASSGPRPEPFAE